MKTKLLLLSFLGILQFIGCKANNDIDLPKKIITEAEQLDKYLPLTQGKKVGVMCNQTTVLGDRLNPSNKNSDVLNAITKWDGQV